MLSLNHALALPKPVLPRDERLKRLEEEHDILLDWLVDEREKLAGVKAELDALQAKIASLQVTVSFGGQAVAMVAPAREAVPVEIPAPANPGRHYGANGPNARVLAALTEAWTSLGAIAEKTGYPPVKVSKTLWVLKMKGLAERGQFKHWRKVRQPGQNLQIVNAT